MKYFLKIAAILLSLNLLASGRAQSETVPPGGELLTLKEAAVIDTFKAAQGATISFSQEGGGPGVKVEFTAAKKYPGVIFPAPTGGWDLSTFTGVVANVTNAGKTGLKVTMSVDNEGDWQAKPWNAEFVYIEPGETLELRVKFGKSYGSRGTQLDLKHISRVQIFTDSPPEEGGAFIVKSIKAD